MITKLNFENFRGFKNLEISPLKRINLIAGANNTGKTAILEALYLLGLKERADVSLFSSVFRNKTGEMGGRDHLRVTEDDLTTFWQSLFYDRQLDEGVKIVATLESGKVFRCFLASTSKQPSIKILYEEVGPDGKGIRVPRPGANYPLPEHLSKIGDESFSVAAGPEVVQGNGMNPFPMKCMVVSTHLQNPIRLAELYNMLMLQEGGEEKVLNLLRKVDPRLVKLRFAKAPGTSQPLVYAHFGLRNALCLTQTGQGFNKLFSLFSQMILAEADVMLIDEIENGLYYEAMPQVWKGLAVMAAEAKVQVFATTHSRECIMAAHQAFAQQPEYDLALHRLQEVKGKLQVVTHDRGMLDAAAKSGLDVR
jgi:hypothetical protein